MSDFIRFGLQGWQPRSKRELAKERAGLEDVFQYDVLPEQFKNQVIHIWNDALGTCTSHSIMLGPLAPYYPTNSWIIIYNKFAREKGVLLLSDKKGNAQDHCIHFLMER